MKHLAVILGALLFSCASAKPPLPVEQAEEPYAETRPRVADRQALTVSLPAEGIEFDFRKSYLATEAQIYTALYEGLFSYHPFTMEPVPAAVSKWKLSEDKKEWVFTLRSEARYWNGDKVRASDFRDAWLSYIDPDRKAPYSSLFDIVEGARDYRLGKIKDPAKVGIQATDERTLVIKLVSPASFFPAMLCHHSFSPAHPSMLNVKDWSKVSLISNGPYYLLRKTDDSLVLERNELYWDAREVEIKRITVKLSEDPDSAAELWNSGEARWISGNVNLDRLKDRSGVTVNPIFATHYYYIRSVHKPWNDPKVRSALLLALPWEEIRAGYLLPAKTLIYPISGYPEIDGLSSTDIKGAKAMLVAAGFPQGKGLPEIVLRLTPGQESERIGSLIAASWKTELGVNTKIEVVPYSAYFESLKDDGYDVGFSTWIGDFADPYTFLQMWRRDSNLNDAHLNDSEFERLLDRSMLEDGETRYQTLAKAEARLLESGTVLPISHSYAVNIVDTAELEGWFRNVLDIHPFKYFAYRKLKPLPGVVLAPK